LCTRLQIVSLPLGSSIGLSIDASIEPLALLTATSR
jgi:hypothetical protein